MSAPTASPPCSVGTSAAGIDKKLKRRVPDSARQRAAAACNRCKARKVRCIRNLGSVASDPCAACAQLGVSCEASVKKPKRNYAVGDHLSARYRALDELIRGLCPGESVDDLSDIIALASRKGIGITVQEEKFDKAFDPFRPPHSSQPNVLTFPSNHTSPSDPAFALKVPEGRLIPASTGGYHYVGPSSSYMFANTIRYLVAKSQIHTPTDSWSGLWRQIRAAEFTSPNRTTALDARIQGHPMTKAADEDNADTSPAAIASPQHSERSGATITNLPVPHNQSWTVFLPSRDVADRLVKAFFARVHPNMPIFHRGAFFTKYETLWSAAALTPRSLDNVPIPDRGWLCSLFLCFVHGAHSLERDGLADASGIQERYLAIIVRHGLQRMIMTPTLQNVQALMLLSLYQHNSGERNTAWMVLGHAARTAIALGIQRDGENGNFDPVERNVRRMVWWHLHLFEQNLCSILGRPTATNLLEVSATLPDEEVIDGSDLPPSFLTYAVSLSCIAARIKRFIGAVSIDFDKPTELEHASRLAHQIDQQLHQWLEDLPPHLQVDQYFAVPKHQRAVLLLHVQHNYLRSCLGRPYLLSYIDWQLNPQTEPMPPSIAMFAETCLTGSEIVIEYLLALGRANLLEGEVWYDFFYAQHAALILSLPFLPQAANPRDETPAAYTESPQEKARKAAVYNILSLAQSTRLAPTYRILVHVAIQFARIVGTWPESVGEAEDNVFPPYSSTSPLSQTSAPTFAFHEPSTNVGGTQSATVQLADATAQPEKSAQPLSFSDFTGPDLWSGLPSLTFPNDPIQSDHDFTSNTAGQSAFSFDQFFNFGTHTASSGMQSRRGSLSFPLVGQGDAYQNTDFNTGQSNTDTLLWDLFNPRA